MEMPTHAKMDYDYEYECGMWLLDSRMGSDMGRW